MKINHIIETDKGMPYWRISIRLNNPNEITIKTENFKLGFNSGEDWDKIFFSKKNYYVSFITKDSSKLDSYKPILISKFYEVIELNLNEKELEIQKELNKVKNLETILKLDLFSNIKSKYQRDSKIDKILEI